MCASCGIEVLESARFCHGCGSAIAPSTAPAEYKQVTVLFADVVHSMHIATAVGAERLREIMAELVNRAAVVVGNYDGTLDKFTGDGFMALFGAPVALEDHALRACLAALAIQTQAGLLADELLQRDGVELRLRIGLNSGTVIAGEIGSGTLGYTAIGVEVGMAQRMESVAPPGGVMLSESTARLVEDVTTVGEREFVNIKGIPEQVAARRLLGIVTEHRGRGNQSTLVGRNRELRLLGGALERATTGGGGVVGIVGLPGIGKSRLVAEIAAHASGLGVPVFSAYCESHTRGIPFRTVADLLRSAMGLAGRDAAAARTRVRLTVKDASGEDLRLLEDLLGIADPTVLLPEIDPDARRRRLTAVVNSASLGRGSPAVYLIEDVHWVDLVSESMLADFIAVIPQTPALVVITYRPEYRGVLAALPGAQTITLGPLNPAHVASLTSELLGHDPSIADIETALTARAAGNPFFLEEMVRDLADRGVLGGHRGQYRCDTHVDQINVPATLQATIAARIDRLDPAAKRTLNAAAVIGSRFDPDLLTTLGIESDFSALVDTELLDQATGADHREYVFRHPVIRAVAYESQLAVDRAALHRRLAEAIAESHSDSVGDHAALIAEHLHAAGDLSAAYAWHMRAGEWSANRDITAARLSWERALQAADRLPGDVPDRTARRITPRTLLCGTAWRAASGATDAALAELRELCTVAGDLRSLAIGTGGQLLALMFRCEFHAASQLASDHSRQLDELNDPTLTAGLLYGAIYAKAQTGEVTEARRLAQRVIDLADADPRAGNSVIGSPLALAITMRGVTGIALGHSGWKDDILAGVAMARTVDPITLGMCVVFGYGFAISSGALVADAMIASDTAEALRVAEQAGDDLILSLALLSKGIALIDGDHQRRAAGEAILESARDTTARNGWTLGPLVVDMQIAKAKVATGDIDGAIALSRAALDRQFEIGAMYYRGVTTTLLVETLLRRGSAADVREAEAAVERLAAVPTEPGFVLHEISLLRLRALLAKTHHDESSSRDLTSRYRSMATQLGFEGHAQSANAPLRT
ncbi:MAG TPA: adenylate/guanylate cyclase domain-containing protein [Mycobacterium sp.]|nr:adenylate/guanylate cyclase domain-containing protein [Mycobacterium sp.]